jgi:hypothetical protein
MFGGGGFGTSAFGQQQPQQQQQGGMFGQPAQTTGFGTLLSSTQD